MKNDVLYYGDNLPILRNRDYFPDGSVDLVYLDPPFNSKADYNILFKEDSGESSQAQIKAFTDFWQWDEAAARTFQELVTEGPHEVSKMLAALCDFIGRNDMTAYLVMMAARLIELQRVLKATGSIYLHCDPTASHYLKVVMDTIFGKQNFRAEIIWKRSSAHSDAKQGRRQYGRLHDVLLFYTKTGIWTWNWIHSRYDDDYLRQFYKYVDPESGRRYRLDNLSGPGGAAKGNPRYEVMGVTRYWRYSKEKMRELIAEGRVVQTRPGAVPAYKRYLDEMPGVPLQDMWTDISPIGAAAAERLGYQTQKPQTLLERIIQASSNPGDIVLDPFCGCGTAVVAAQKLGRQWIGIDITYLAVNVMRKRLQDSFPGLKVEVVGEPVDLESARSLAHEGPGDHGRWQFQWWALSLIDAQPVRDERKKGSDKGIDGVITFMDVAGKPARAIISVKSGHVNSAQVRDLKGVMEREKVPIGIFITLDPPSKGMRTEAATAGFHRSDLWKRDFARLQIVTVEDLLAGKGPDIPGRMSPYSQAQRIANEGRQGTLV